MSEMKRSSYYVLFLGAKESKGLRGVHYIEPVLQYFISQEHRIQALKATLQVSNKGLRIIPCTNRVVGSGNGPEIQTEKHFIPHHAITCVFQAPPPNDDIVSVILLIFNPDTKCPVHVHCYRCDSAETASVLRSQLDTLVNREDNQKKLRDIEIKLQSKGLLPCSSPARRDIGTPEFDCRTSDSSDNSDRGFGSGSGTSNLTTDRVASLYDSLAAELRDKLNARKKNTPILLPPRDYDTMHRQRGNLSGIETRRCSNPAVVGSGILQRTRRSYASRELESCGQSCGGRSSGIGSADDNCSPIRNPHLDSHGAQSSSDDEDWSPSQIIVTENSQYLVRPTWPSVNSPARSSSSPVPPPLPKRPELRQRSPDVSGAAPPPPIFSRERFEGVRQKWERLDHQYVRHKSHDSLDDGYRSREVVEADYRRQLSRESLLRSMSRSKTGSRDSLDRWIENGVRSRGLWRRAEDQTGLIPAERETHFGQEQGPVVSKGQGTSATKGQGAEGVNKSVPKSGNRDFNSPKHRSSSAGMSNGGGKHFPPQQHPHQSTSKGGHPTGGSSGGGSHPSRYDARRNPRDKNYKELEDQERFPGLDRDTARTTLHSSNLNLSQHIYSEPSFDAIHLIPPPPPPPSKSKRFSFSFWK